ncbi:MAG: hypothetical protein SNJ29_16945 [Rikenellaceae bacterium]
MMNKLKNIGIIPVDFSVLRSIFSHLASPRNKVALLEKSGQLVRLKRGLYVVSPTVSGVILSTELIANHIYGPSYVSMESALRFYGLIPESVYAVRSMTIKRSQNFENSIARFDYTQCGADYYSIGIQQVTKDNHTFLIATPEKALCDLIAYTPKLNPRFINSMRTYLEEDLRLDMEQFYKMDIEIFRKCAKVGKKSAEINNIIKILENESI